MSITGCPAPDPRYIQLKTNLGKYQANRVVESFTRNSTVLPDVNSAEMDHLVRFWKKTNGFEGETVYTARTRILSKYGRNPGSTNAFIHNQYKIQAQNDINHYHNMTGKKLFQLLQASNGQWYIKIITTKTDYDVLPRVEEEPQTTPLEHFTTPDSKIPRFSILIQTYMNKKRDYGRQINELRQRKKEVSDPKRKLQIADEIERIEDLVTEVEDNIKELEAKKAVESLYPYAQRDFNELSTFLNRDSLEDSENITLTQLNFARNILRTWSLIADSNNPSHPFLDESEIAMKGVKDELDSIYSKAKYYTGIMEKLALKKIMESTGTYLGRKLDESALFSPREDANFFSTNMLALQRMEPTLLQAIAMKIKDIEFISTREYTKTEEEFNDLLNKAINKLSRMNKKDPFNIFRQLDADGFETGNVVFRYTQGFFDISSQLSRNARFEQDPDMRSANYKKLFEFQRENMFFIDPERINQSSYIDELKKHYGEKGVDQLTERVIKQQKKFEEDYETARILYESENITGAEVSEYLDAFDKKNNPKYYLQNLEQKTLFVVGGELVYPTAKYIVSIPRRFKSDGKATGFYDSKYDRISADNDLYNFHEKIIDMLSEYKRYIPYSLSKDLQINSIPSLTKTMFELFGEEGFMETGKHLLDQFFKSNGIQQSGQVTYQSVDPITGSVEPSLAFKVHFDTDNEIKEKVNVRIAELKSKGKYPKEIKAQRKINKRLFQEERDKMSKEKSWDLGKIMKIYSFATIQYKHKARVEDLLTWQKRIFEDKAQQTEDSFGKVRYTPTGEPIKERGDQLTEYKKSLDHTMNAFLGMPMRDIEGKTGKVSLNIEETERKKELIAIQEEAQKSLDGGVIDMEEYQSVMETTNKEISKLGSEFVFSKVGDNFIKYFQLRGMGWNLFAGIANVGFGLMSNMTLAADGREFNEKNFWQAFRISTASIANNASFDSTKKINNPFFKEAFKLRSMMDKNNILKEASHEMFKRSMGDKTMSSSAVIAKKLKFLNPYNPQMRSEYLVQSMLLAAMMKSDRNMVTDVNGKQRPLWDAFDINGNWNYEEFGVQPEWEYNGDKMLNFLRRVDSVIAEAHGDYSNPLRIKKSFVGRAASQFRTWMFEGFANRFEEEKFDEIRGYKRKGRYRSMDAGYYTLAGMAIGTSMVPGIGTLIGGTAGFIAGRTFGIETGRNPVQSTLFALKQLARRMLITQSVFGKDISLEYGPNTGFTDVDAANMRKNMTELSIYIYLWTFGMMMRSLGDDDDPKIKYALNFLINQGNRLETDILFYTNPVEAKKLSKQIIPALSLFEDAERWFEGIQRVYGENPDFMSGPFEGTNVLLKRTMEAVPLGSQYYKTKKNLLYVMDI